MEQDIENITFSRFVSQPIPFELISIEELYRRCEQSNYDLSIPHRIAFHALIIIIGGRGSHTVDFREEKLSSGVILPLAKGQVHAFSKVRSVTGYIISFEENFIIQNISEKHLFHFLQFYNTPSIRVTKKSVAALEQFIQLLQELHLDTKIDLKAEIIHSTFMALLFNIKRHSTYKKEIFESKRFNDFIRFKQLIAIHYEEDHNVVSYANRMNVSYKYLNDICKQIANKTAKGFLDSWLLLEIKRNISENKYTSQEIAFKMGFNEPSNFIRFFKKFTGRTPNQFLEDLKN